MIGKGDAAAAKAIVDQVLNPVRDPARHYSGHDTEHDRRAEGKQQAGDVKAPLCVQRGDGLLRANHRAGLCRCGWRE